MVTPSPKKPVFCRFLANFFLRNLLQNIPFSENCVAIWRLFAQKKSLCATSIVTKGGGAFYINFEKLCPSLYIYIYLSKYSTLSNTGVQQGRNEGEKAKDTCPILQNYLLILLKFGMTQ